MKDVFNACHTARIMIRATHDACIHLDDAFRIRDATNSNGGIADVGFDQPDSFFDGVEHRTLFLISFQRQLICWRPKSPGRDERRSSRRKLRGCVCGLGGKGGSRDA